MIDDPSDPTTSGMQPPAAAEDAGAGDLVPTPVAVVQDEPPRSAPTSDELGLELPEDEEEARRLLLRELGEARQEAGEYLETLQRVAAEFDNFRKRVERDHIENVRRASQRVIEALLPTLDSFDAAMAVSPQSAGEEALLAGMQGTHSQLIETLAAEGLAAIPARGEAFDPAVHEAVSGPAGPGDGDLMIAQELRRGYVMQGRVLRPALVTVEHA